MAATTVPPAVSGYFAALRSNDPSAFAAVFAPDGISHDPVGTPPIIGRDAIRSLLDGILTSWGRFDGITEDEAFTSGNAVTVRWTGRGAAPTGSPIEWTGINLFLLDEDGLIDTLYAVFDGDDVARQLAA